LRLRWPFAVAYVLIVLVELAILVGAYVLHVMSQGRMMLMRYLFARNLELEAVWFSPTSIRIQIACFAVVAIVSVLLAARAHDWLARLHWAVGAFLAAFGAWLAATQTTADVYALYAGLGCLWVVLVLHATLGVVTSRQLGRS